MTQTSRQAFWRALTILGISILVLWSILLYVAPDRKESWPVYVFFAVLTLLIIIAILYYRYQKKDPAGEFFRLRTRKAHLAYGILWGAFGICEVVLALIFPRNFAENATQVVLGILWIVFSIEHFRLALKAQISQNSNAT